MVKNNQKNILQCLKSSLMILVYTLVFSLFSLVFLIDQIPLAVQIIFGAVFMAPVLLSIFFYGKTNGSKAFKDASKKLALENKKSNQKVVEIPVYKCIYHVLFYVCFLLFFLLLSIIIKNNIIHGIVSIILMPVTLMFNTVIPKEPVTWVSFGVYFPFILLIAAAYIFGFIIQIKTLNNQKRDIENELRMFNN